MPEYSRLCRLIDESLLRSYTKVLQEQGSFSLTEELEKELLIALSQVLRQIKLWTDEFEDSDSDSEPMPTVAVNSQKSVCSMSHPEGQHCLTNTTTELIFLLGVENLHVKYLAGNVLVSISEFVAASGSYWDDYMHLLGLCLELSVCNSLPSSDSLNRVNDLDCHLSSMLALNPILKYMNWSTVAGIIHLLRNILKFLRKECDDQLLEVYLDSIRTCLPKIPWELLDDILLGQNGRSWCRPREDASIYTPVEQLNPAIIFCGNLVQLFCSLLAQRDSSGTAVLGTYKQHITCEINNAIPKVLIWCLGEKVNCSNPCISHYFRHKILMLLIRLSFQIQLNRSVLLSSLNLVHKYFEDLLLEPIIKLASDKDDCLEGSPFSVGFPVGKMGMSYRHLQRLAVFLFLRCSLSLVSRIDGTEEHFVCANQNSCLVLDHNWGTTCCSRKQGFLELYEWIQKHLSADILSDNEFYFEKSISFALSFLQLYMHEDDILFKMLLQLVCVPFSEREGCKAARTSREAKDDVLFLVSNLFNPIHMFHLFLAELLYDHQVLLDYLISKDTGASSAEYLLRCLRTICDSWNVFVEFSLGDEVMNQAHHCNKRKVPFDDCDCDFQVGSFFAQDEGDGNLVSLEKGCKRKYLYDSKQQRTNRLPFENAVECMLSLKKSLENLHQKNLFPYNPDVLLRRLKRFAELGIKQKKMLIQRVE